ncbi:hypothetical protein [Mycolicibacterium komossense]|uniref:Uncharacterized protein n=1 Tax=Mycolicibacterium komossense TaxID=1779 RepID=A0ABT3CMH3_9MYCO|nr:hypothetical protein [Mycolicibacterium komossense]MCV7230657.1 hypothetical protein [Mycolicibacterium komossense]
MSVFIDGHVQLDSLATMYAVHSELAGVDGSHFRGQVSLWQEAGAVVSSLEISSDRQPDAPALTARVGDHLVLLLGRLLKFTDAEYQAAQP